MKLDTETIEKLKREHDELYVVSVDGVELVLRLPTREHFKRFLKHAGKNDPFLASEELVRDCTVWPSAEELDAILERRPGLVMSIADNLLRAAGAASEVKFRAL